MSGILALLNTTKSEVKLGQIDTLISGNQYYVYIDGVKVKAEKAITDSLYDGAQVLINNTENKRYIIGLTKSFKGSVLKEVVING
ncbi:MAG: hypothetical protein U9P90_01575 [Patescibacteria group bacterium]|nr:hypothetical protein [Patescibacteria group bacterium]